MGWHNAHNSVHNFAGKISEMTFFDSSQSANREAIEKHIADFHNIEFPPPPSSSTYVIANNTDDGYTVSNSTSSSSVQFNGSLINSSNSTIEVGGQDDDGDINYFVGYFRFNNIAIDQGATIQSAILKPIKRGFSGSANKNFEIAGRDVDNSGVPTSASNLGTRTTARVTLSKSTIVNTANNSIVEVPDIKTIIQEIVDRAGWSSGNSIVLSIYTPSQFVNNPIVARFGSKYGGHAAELVITI